MLNLFFYWQATVETRASISTVTWCNGPLVSVKRWPSHESFARIIPVLFDPTMLQLSVSSISLWFSELVAGAQAVPRPSASPQHSKRDEAAVCHVYGGLSAWQGVRHSLGSTSCITCSSILHCGSCAVPSASSSILSSTVLLPEIWFLIKSTVNGGLSCNKNERSYTPGWGVSRGN